MHAFSFKKNNNMHACARAHTHTTFNFIDVIYICRMHMNDDACCLHFISLLYIVSLLACDEDVVVRSAATASLALILVHFATIYHACGADRFHPRRGGQWPVTKHPAIYI